MDNNFQDDYLLLEKDKKLFNSKVKKQKIILTVILLLFCILIYYVYQDEIESFLPDSRVITVESKDKTQKMSLMRKNIKYNDWPDPCPNWYHTPTAYEWERVFRIRCENNEICDVNDISSSDNQWKRNFHYWHYWKDEIALVLKDFLKDFNISLDRRSSFTPWWIYREKFLGIKYTSIFGTTRISNRLRITPTDIKDDGSAYMGQTYIRCFSNENLTPEYLKDEDARIRYNLLSTKIEFDWKEYSWRKILGYNGYSFNKDIIIPETFEWIPIIEIWEWAFERHWYISVNFGKNLVKISDNAFKSNSIKEIIIPENVIYIGEHAFSANQLTSIIIPDSVKYVWKWAFGFNKITSLQLPSWLKIISPELFTHNNLEMVEIPYWIETIGYSAFSDSNIKDLIIPSTVKEIWNSSFAGNDLTEISLPQSVKIIWTGAFCSQKKSTDNLDDDYVTIKWYPKEVNTCINTSTLKVCNSKKENRVCWVGWYAYRNSCFMKAYWNQEDQNYEFVDWKCVSKKD